MSNFYVALDAVPLWVIFLLTLLVVLLSIRVGHSVGLRAGPRTAEETSVNSVVAAVLGLLAFMLAFTFGLASSRFEARRGLVLDEANAVGTTYLRAGMIEEPERSEVKALLREYVDVRVEAIRTRNLEPALVRSREIHDRLWQDAGAVAARDPHSIINGLFVQALNQVIDLHESRVAAGRYARVPGPILGALVFVTVCSMLVVGYQSGTKGTRSIGATVILALTFSAVIWLILDLDRAGRGLVQVGQQAMLDLQSQMRQDVVQGEE